MKIVFTLLGLILLGSGAWYVSNGGGNSDTAHDGQEMTEHTASDLPSNEKQQFKGSMQELMARSGSPDLHTASLYTESAVLPRGHLCSKNPWQTNRQLTLNMTASAS